MSMEALDQVRVKDECGDYELGHSMCACTKIYATRMSTFSTMLMNPIVGVL